MIESAANRLCFSDIVLTFLGWQRLGARRLPPSAGSSTRFSAEDGAEVLRCSEPADLGDARGLERGSGQELLGPRDAQPKHVAGERHTFALAKEFREVARGEPG